MCVHQGMGMCSRVLLSHLVCVCVLAVCVEWRMRNWNDADAVTMMALLKMKKKQIHILVQTQHIEAVLVFACASFFWTKGIFFPLINIR